MAGTTRPSEPAISAPEQREKDDGGHTLTFYPFIMLTSSTAIDAAIAEECDQNGKTDRGFRCGNGQDQQREDLPDKIVQEGRRRRRS